MFRRLPQTLPKDPKAPADLKALGYFVNDNDQIRQIRNPEQKYQFAINRNDRVNDIYKEAMNTCVRRLVDQGMTDMGFKILRLPLGSAATNNHVPIWLSPDISIKKRVIVLFGERNNDLGIFSYRVTGDEGINVGSCLDLARAIQQGPTATSDDQVPGIVIANPAQLLWYRGGGRAVTVTEWANLPKESAVHDSFRFDEVKNHIPHNGNFREHINYVFEQVLPAILHKDAKVDLIGLEWPGAAALEYLAVNWSKWESRISGICLGGPQHKVEDLQATYNSPEAFIEFLSKRSRAYFVSHERLESVVGGREEFGCNCYSSGEELYEENVIVRSWRSMLDWFNLIHILPEYEEPERTWLEAQDGRNGDNADKSSGGLNEED